METEVEKTPATGSAAEATRTHRLSGPIGVFACLLLATTWSWWALKYGAWFGTVLLPGAIVLCVGLIVLLRAAPRSLRLRAPSPLGLSLGALIVLGAWTTLSAVWSPAPATAIGDGQRAFVYALSFGIGAWTAALLGSRRQLALTPLAVAGAVAGGVTAVALITGDDARDYLEFDNTLEYPIGYRNANAAFFLCAFFPALGLAGDRQLDWRFRGAALAIATLCLDLALLSQSRGSALAALAAGAVYLLASPVRLRALAWLLLAAGCAAGVLPALTDLYGSEGEPGSSIDELNAAGIAVAATAAVAAALGSLAAFADRRRAPARSVARGNRAVAVGLAALCALSAVAFVVRVGDPVEWIGQKTEELGSGSPDLSAESTRFGVNLESERSELWKVALDQFGENPALGDGSGGFQYRYQRERETTSLEAARDAHSVELELLGELGLPGLALLLISLGGAVVAALRARRTGPAAATLSAVALATGTYWLVHASVDWFWPYPAITAPVMALLGAAGGALLLRPNAGGGETSVGRPTAGRARLLAGVGAVVLGFSVVPPFLSERYVNDAYAGWREDLERAYDDLDRAAVLDPFSDVPLLAEGAIADSAGDPERAAVAWREAVSRVPDEWATHYLLADLYAETEPQLARAELDLARELNPLDSEVQRLTRILSRPAE